MSIVRSLLINIGFATDKGTVSQAERTVSTFKRKSLLAASAITYAFGRVASYFSDFASNIIDTDNFSKYIGIAIDDLYSLQKAAQQVSQISEQDFQTAVGNLQKMFHDLRVGASGELQLIADQLGFQIDRTNDNGVTLFNKILKALSNVEDAAQRSRIAENIFKGVDFKKFADLSGNIDKFADAAKKVGEDNKISGQVQSLRDYAQAVNELSQTWQDFIVSISGDVIPALQSLISVARDSIGVLKGVGTFYKGLFNLDSSKIAEGANIASKALDPLFETTGLNNISNFFKSLWRGEFNQGILDYIENREGYIPPSQRNMMSPNITVNNDISIPAGTTEDQAQFMADRIQQTIQDSIDSTFRTIQYNNPVIE